MAPSVDPMNVPGELIWLPGRIGGATEGPSPVEQLLRHFKDHEHKEQKTLEEYRHAIERASSPAEERGS